MGTIIYNKLVRDNIPEIIQVTGKSYTISTLDEARYIEELKKKLVEESLEVRASESLEKVVEELADVLEVIDAIQKALCIRRTDIQCARNRKAQRNECFEKRIFLHSVVEGQ